MADSTLALALIGCGGMGLRHLHGLAELQSAGLSPFELAAVCDARPEAAHRGADLAEQLLGRRPDIFTDAGEMLASPVGGLLDAVDLATDAGTHQHLGLPVLDAGKHLLSEKPLALTVRACRSLVDAAAEAGVVLATAENYRHDPINRLVAALIHGGAIGRPFVAMQESIGGGRAMTITPWRHQKERGGIVIDMGVHYADLWRYFLGPIDRISGRAALFEPMRHPAPPRGPMAAFYSTETAPVRATAEDTSVGQVTFASGALGQWMLSMAGHGEGYFVRRFYGSEGSLDVPADRSGRPVRYAGSALPGAGGTDRGRPLDRDAIRALAPDFRLNDPTDRLFGSSVLASYELSFEEIDRKLLALEIADFGRAIREGRPPEVDGVGGLEAVAMVYAFFESALLGREVTLAEVAGGAVAGYQHDIDAILGLL